MEKQAEAIFLNTLSVEKDKIFRICNSYASDHEGARDLFQEVVYNFWKSLPSFKGKSSLATWLYRIAINVCLKDKAKKRVETIRHVAYENFEDKIQQNPLLEDLYTSIKKLNKVDRALVMLYLEELPYKEIATVMGLTENHVAVKMKRIRAKLLTHLKKGIMMDNELKNIWKQARTQELVQLNHTKLITEMEHAHKTTERAIKRRDSREIWVAILLMPIFLFTGIYATHFMTQLGAFLMIPVLGFIIYKLKSVKKYKPASVNTPSQTYLEQLKLYYTMEMDLLKDVLYWYLIPPGLCLAMIYWGTSDSRLGFYVSIGGIVVMYTVIYFMNQAAVKKRYIPLLKSIEDSLHAFKND